MLKPLGSLLFVLLVTTNLVATETIQQARVSSTNSGVALMDLNMILPPGRSRYVHNLATPVKANPLRFGYVISGQCPQNAFYLENVFVRYVNDANWYQTTTTSAGLFSHSDKPLAAVEIRFLQNMGRHVTCRVTLTGEGQGPTDPGTVEERYAGVIQYGGGFVYRERVPMSNVYQAQSFRIAVPNYCQGLEINEVELDPAGVFQPATTLDAQRFIYAAAQPTTLDELVVTLNGPPGLACDLPVYARTPISNQ